MRTILKQVEPDGFISWKSANQEKIDRYIAEGKTGEVIWKLLLSNLGKDEAINDYSASQLRRVLVEEQFHICCYCNDSIKGESLDTKIEHFLPKETYKEDIFNYLNLIAACNGGERDEKPPNEPNRRTINLHCDTHKGPKDPSQFQLVSPFDNDSSTHFLFRESGEISGITQKGIDTISFLNLDCPKLNLRRKAVIKTYLEILGDDEDEGENIDSLIKEVSEIINGKLQTFCTAILCVLKIRRGIYQ
jgi:uncharacterized protein (TIGR02646 family)